MKSEVLVKHIAKELFAKKAEQIVILNVQGVSDYCDFILIANGSVERHVLALSRLVQKALKERHMQHVHVEGESMSDWIVIDAGEFICHLFVPHLRDKYRLESLWKEAKIVPVRMGES